MLIFLSIASFILFTCILVVVLRSRFSLSTINMASSRETQISLGLVYDFIRIYYVRESSGKSMSLAIHENVFFKKRLRNLERVSKTEPTASKTRIWHQLGGMQWTAFTFRLRKLFACFDNPQIEGDLRCGFVNPYHTGMLTGIYSILAEILPRLMRRVVFQPNFCDSRSAWKLRFSADFVPALTIWHGFRLWRCLGKSK
jgi:hypothetical protein